MLRFVSHFSLVALTLFGCLSAFADNYDDSFFFGPNYYIDQESPELAPYGIFDQDGESGLCGPTTLTHELIYQAYYQSKPDLKLQTIIPLKSDGKYDPYKMVYQITARCHVNRNTGTNVGDLGNCIFGIYQNLGIKGSLKDFKGFSYSPLTKPEFTIDDLRNALKNKKSILVAIGWYSQDGQRHAGHLFGVYGYTYNYSWNQTKIVLRIYNPSGKSRAPHSPTPYDDVWMQQGIDSPFYAIVGQGFGAYQPHLGLIEDVIIFGDQP